jgi:hypothetical protein
MDFAPEPELVNELDFSQGPIEFGDNDAPGNTLAEVYADAIAGEGKAGAGEVGFAPAEGDGGPGSAIPGETTDEKLDHYINQGGPQDCRTQTPTAPEGPPMPLSAKIGPLSRTQRARYMLNQAWTGIRHWVSCNWPTILAAILVAIIAIAAIVAVVVLSGGTVGVALSGILAAFTGAMIIYAIARAAGFLRDYLQKSLDGDIIGGARGLARALAVAAVEIIFAILTYVTAGAFRVVAAGVKGAGRLASGAARGAGRLAAGAARQTARGARAVGRGAMRVGRGVARATGRAGRATGRVGSAVVQRGKLVIRNVRSGFERGVRNLRDLGRRLGQRLRFRRFKLERRGGWFRLYGLLNPWVLLANGRVQEVDLPSGTRVGKTVTLPGSRRVGTVIGQSRKAGEQVRSAAVRHIDDMTKAQRMRLSRSLREQGSEAARSTLRSTSRVEEVSGLFRRTTGTGPAGVNVGDWFHDALGRLRRVRGRLSRVHKHGRSSAERSAQRSAGHAGQAGDEGGHALAHRFLGDQGMKNLFAQAGRMNRSAYKTLENEMADWVRRGCIVEPDFRFLGHTASRPGMIRGSYTVINPSTGARRVIDIPPLQNAPGAIYSRIPFSEMIPP